MSIAVSFAQFFLAVVFAVAGCSKLADRAATRVAIEDFHVPRPIATPAAILVPLIELAVAATLVPAPTARVGALAAVALLAVFSFAIIRVLRAGSTPDCNCFGGLTQTEVGRGTLFRNLALAALAVFVATSQQSVGALHWLTLPASGDRPLFAAMAAVIAGLGWFCWGLLRQNGRLLRRLEDGGVVQSAATGAGRLTPLETGVPAPEFDGHDLTGEPVSLASLLARGHPVTLFFTDAGCGACELVLDAVAEVQQRSADKLTVAVLSGGSIDRIKLKAAEFGLDRVIPQGDAAVFDAYRVEGFPALVEINSDGSIAGTPVLGADPVRATVLGGLPSGPAGSSTEAALS